MTTTHRSPLTARRVRLALAGTATTLGALALVASPASAQPSDTTRIPAAGAPVTCDHVGTLTGASGYLQESESTHVDRQGRAHVLFTISAHHVVLTGDDGTSYRLVGGGFDAVLYRTSDVTGDIQHEAEAFVFDVLVPRGRVGVVRFWLHSGSDGSDQIPRVRDSSTCQLPDMS